MVKINKLTGSSVGEVKNKVTPRSDEVKAEAGIGAEDSLVELSTPSTERARYREVLTIREVLYTCGPTTVKISFLLTT